MSTRITGVFPSLALLITMGGPAVAQPVAVADYLLTVERLELSFTAAQLLANDVHGPMAQVAIESGAGSGTVSCVDDGSCTYLPDVGFAGEDLFTYRVVEPGQVSPPAAVRIRVTPVVVPLAGDWNDDGAVDLGWFDSLCQSLHLAEIDWTADAAAAPPVVSALPLPAGSLGWIPFAGDWDGEGHDDVGTFDPLTRTYYLYLQEQPLPPGPLSPPTWILLTSFTASVAGQGGLPVAGDWDEDRSAQAGLYLPLAQQVALLGPEGVATAIISFQTPPPSDRLPVAGDWGGNGEKAATVGLYSPSQRILLVSDHQSLNPAYVRYYSDQPAGMLPIVGKWTSVDTGDGIGESIAFYVPTAQQFGSFMAYPCDFVPGGCGGQQPLPIGPPEDPLGAGCPLRTTVYPP